MRLIFANDQEAVRALREAGLKATPQRLAVLRSLDGDETHPTAQELHERLSHEFPSLSVATVYNTLSALTRIARCTPLDLGGPLRFDPNVEPHDHAVCESCGSIRDVDGADATHPDTTYAKNTDGLQGFAVKRVERIYRGLCASCTSHENSVSQSPTK
jgi:Fe2+ or Zn2+ uptake regulation protein